MEKNMIFNTLQAVINTLNGATLRADQHDAFQRISACTNELHHLMELIEQDKSEEKQKEG